MHMDIEHQTGHVESGWKMEIGEHADQINLFLQQYLKTPHEQRQRYSDLELQFSGYTSSIAKKITEGNGKINTVRSLYDKGVLRRIHVVFDSEGVGSNLDVFLTGRALEDYLNAKGTKI